MEDELLITKAEFPPYADMPQEVNDRFVNPFILQTQVEILESALCVDLYQELLTQKKDGTLTADNTLLLDRYIRPVIVYYAWAFFIVRHGYKVTTHGVVIKYSDASEKAELDERILLASDSRSTGKTFLARLIKFLKENRDKYPSYCNDGCGKGSIPDNSNGFF